MKKRGLSLLLAATMVLSPTYLLGGSTQALAAQEITEKRFNTQNFNATVNAQLLYMVLVGIDSAILYDLPIEPKAVWHEAILKLFIRKDSQ